MVGTACFVGASLVENYIGVSDALMCGEFEGKVVAACGCGGACCGADDVWAGVAGEWAVAFV